MAASASILLVVLIFVFLGREAFPLLRTRSLSELLGTWWVPVSREKTSFGLLPLLNGTLLVTGTTMVITIPVGICAAVYIAEFARPVERHVLRLLIDLLATVPSVVLGFFGLVVLGPLLKDLFGLSTGMTALTGSLLLTLMALPTVISISEEALCRVPHAWKQASLALGASPFQTTWRVTVPAAAAGIVASVTLAVGRVVGETMAVLMATGNAPAMTLSPLESVRTMTATIALEMGEIPLGSEHYRALFCIGVLLLMATFALNWIAQRALRKQNRLP
jgi:phosphate transport system permease protein